MQKPQKPTVNKPTASKPSGKPSSFMATPSIIEMFGTYESRYTSITDIITPADKYTKGESTSQIDIGVEGARKTSAFDTIPDTFKDWKDGKERPLYGLVIDGDNRLGVIDTSKRKNWHIVSIPLNADVMGNYRAYCDIRDGLVNRTIGFDMSDGKKGYDFVIMDSLTPFSYNMFHYIWGTVKGNNWSTGYDGNEERYGELKTRMNALIFAYKDATQFLFCTAHEAEPHWSETDKVNARYKADISGGFKSLAPKLFDEVYFSVQIKDEYKWLTQFAKNRQPRSLHRLPKFMSKDYSIIINRRWDEFKVAETKIETEEEVAE